MVLKTFYMNLFYKVLDTLKDGWSAVCPRLRNCQGSSLKTSHQVLSQFKLSNEIKYPLTNSYMNILDIHILYDNNIVSHMHNKTRKRHSNNIVYYPNGNNNNKSITFYKYAIIACMFSLPPPHLFANFMLLLSCHGRCRQTHVSVIRI